MNDKCKIFMKTAANMDQVGNSSVHLIITSPPYPMIKMWDEMFRAVGCNTYNQMHLYLNKVWKECYRVLVDGGICCINIGDATRSINKNFRLYSNHSRVIELCEALGFQSLPFILWKKISNRPNSFLGSGFLPPNAYIAQDHEFILIFRKGQLRKFEDTSIRHESKYTKEERGLWFSQEWRVPGAKQGKNKTIGRTAEFPEEIPYRLIRMFSCKGEVVLDPFLGTGTTAKVALENERQFIGFETDMKFAPLIEKKIRKWVDKHEDINSIT